MTDIDVENVFGELDWCPKEALYLRTDLGTDREDRRRRKIAKSLRELADEIEP